MTVPQRSAKGADGSRARTRILGVLVAFLAVLAGTAAPALAGISEVPVRMPDQPEGLRMWTSAVPADLTAADLETWLDGVLPSLLEREGIAGAAVSVVAGGEILGEYGYGHADTGVQTGVVVPVDPESTLFRVGSITKMVVGTVAIRLADDGLIDLDAPIAGYLDFELPTRFDTPITMRHLLGHVAGFEERLRDAFLPEGAALPPLRDVVSGDPPQQIAEPGTVPAYSNYGVSLAGYILTRVSGETFEDLVQQHVLTTAGMRHATLAQPPSANASQGYRDRGSPPEQFEVVRETPAGALSATASDMSAFMVALLTRDGSGLLEPGGLERMMEPAPTVPGLANGPVPGVGLYALHRNGHRVVGHGGDTRVFHSELELYPDEGVGLFIALNSSGVGADSAGAVRELVAQGFADRYFPAGPSSSRALPTSAERSEIAAGTYTISRRGESTFLRAYSALTPMRVTPDGTGGILIDGVADSGGAPAILREVEPWVWQSADGRHRIAMHAPDGAVAAIGVHPTMAALPMPPTLAALPWALAFGCAVQLVTAVSWPVAAMARRRHGAPLGETRRGRALRIGTRIAALSALAGAACWVAVALPMLDAMSPAPTLIRLAQALTMLGVLGAIPAVWRATGSLRARRDGVQVVSDVVVAAGFLSLLYAAVVGGLVWPAIAY